MKNIIRYKLLYQGLRYTEVRYIEVPLSYFLLLCSLFFSHCNGDLCAHVKITCYNVFTCEDIMFLCESSPGISFVYLNKMIFFLLFFFLKD